MPQELCPTLSEYNRLELVDNQKNGKPMQTRNQFRSIAEMKALTDDYAHLILSKNSEKEMALLPTADGTPIILVISTVRCDSVPDSSLAFYTTDWKPLRTLDYYTLPPIENFRHITIDPTTHQLTNITTNSLFRLRTDGNDTPKPPVTITTTLSWLAEESRFVP